jgi:hypothetical protein
LTTDHHYPDSTGHDGLRALPRITRRDVCLLLALEVAVMLWAFWTLVGVDLTVANGTQTLEVSLVSLTLTATTGALLSCVGPLLATTASAGVALLSFPLVVGAGLVVGVRQLHRGDG